MESGSQKKNVSVCSALVRMNLEYSVFCSRQHYFDETGTSWSDLKMGSLDSELEMFSLKEKLNSL